MYGYMYPKLTREFPKQRGNLGRGSRGTHEKKTLWLGNTSALNPKP